MRGSKTFLAASALAVAALAGSISVAIGGGDQYPTQFTKFKYESGGTFSGKVDSTKGNCVKERQVVLLRKHNGEEKKVAKDKSTNDKGKFKMSVPTPPKEGKYYAKAKTRDLNNGGTCQKRTSGSVELSKD